MDYLTPEEVAATLRVHISTVRRWIRDGRLPAYRVGRQYRIPQIAYQEFLKQQEMPPQHDAKNSLVLSH